MGSLPPAYEILKISVNLVFVPHRAKMSNRVKEIPTGVSIKEVRELHLNYGISESVRTKMLRYYIKADKFDPGWLCFYKEFLVVGAIFSLDPFIVLVAQQVLSDLAHAQCMKAD